MARPMMTAAHRSALVTLFLHVGACGDGGTAAPTTETACADQADDDDDGLVDCADDDCAGDPACGPVAEACSGGLDEDGDTFVDCDDDDCWDDATCYQVDDPTDVPEPLGDPAVDIDKIRATLVGSTATFFATFDAPWPPPATAYAWDLYFEIDNDGNTPRAGVRLQRVNGVDSMLPVSGFSAGNITVRQTPTGVWARLINVPVAGQKYYIESGIQEASPGTRVTDTVVDAPAPLP